MTTTAGGLAEQRKWGSKKGGRGEKAEGHMRESLGDEVAGMHARFTALASHPPVVSPTLSMLVMKATMNRGMSPGA